MSKKWLIVTTLALTACDPGRPVVSTPPPELLVCEAEPPAPDLPAKDGTDATQLVRDQMMLTAYLALRAAYGSCAANLAGVRAWAETVR